MAQPKQQPTTLDHIQESLDRTLVEVREIEIRTRSDDRVQDLMGKLRLAEFDRDSVTERLERITGFIAQMTAVRIMLEAAREDINTDIAVITDSISTYQHRGYTAGGPKTAQVHEDTAQQGDNLDADQPKRDS